MAVLADEVSRRLDLIERWVERHERRVVLALCGAGTLARMVWLARGDHLATANVLVEPSNVAASLVRHGTFADPFEFATGPTAHLGFLTPIPTAIAYFLFGVHQPMAEIALAGWSLALVAISFWLCWRIVTALDAPPLGRIAATAVVALIPLQFFMEVSSARHWEVLIATCLLLNTLRLIVAALAKDDRRRSSVIAMSLCAGATFLVSPPAGLASAAAVFVYALHRLNWRQWWLPALAFAVITVPPSLAWRERNIAQLGKPIIMRDNIGLELAVSDYPGALNAPDPQAAYDARLDEIHPSRGWRNVARLRAAGGEVAYYDQLQHQTVGWIAANPVDFARLCLRHFRQFYFPASWMWRLGKGSDLIGVRVAIIGLLSLSALISTAVLARNSPAYRTIGATLLVAAVPYIAVQPVLRYRYIISSLLIFIACDGLSRLARLVVQRGAVRLPGAASAR